MIRKLHTHEDGSECYSTGRHEKRAGMYIMDGQEVVISYNWYSAMYYAYNTGTGFQIASFRKEFYDAHIAQYKVGDLVEDPNCLT